ncbi:hypothetical protein V6N11_042099 [Hibiscus sabdariffa]|uniref:Protein kinase domain-containing protein n=1 Tax=Hibiscus sabdariffa TaxID=183260 RepID=A0ABR2QVA4_9ROSI
MGCFPCFDSREEKLNPEKENDDPKQGQPTLPSNISRLSSGGDRLKSRSNGGSKRELPSPRDGPGVQIAAQTFPFRELAAATKNFRPESFIGEGGFGRVYKGRLESTGQVVAVKQLDRNGLQDLPPDKEPLDWNTRMKIAAGAAKELITGRKAIDSTRPHGEQNLVIWARPLFNNRRKFSKLADPLLQGRYPVRGLYQALAVASMCIQEQAATRPLIGDVVTALSYLVNQPYDPNTAAHGSRGSGDTDEKRHRDNRGGRVSKNDEGGASGHRWDLDGSEKEDSPRETAKTLNRDLERERAVAEAKMWGENLREKRRQSDGSNG